MLYFSLEFLMSLSHYDIKTKLGNGSYGEVLKVSEKVSGKLFAIKKISLDDYNSEQAIVKSKETLLLLKIQHINIVKAFSQFYEKNDGKLQMYIVMECADGSLGQQIKNRQKTSQPYNVMQIVYIMYQIAKGVKYLHENNIIHRDLKPDNVLEFSGKEIIYKICDFGNAKILSNSQLEQQCGTVNYMAPEEFEQSIHCTQAVDIWAIGCILYEITFLKMAFPGQMPTNAIQNCQYQIVTQNSTVSLIQQMIIKDASKRIQIDAVVQNLETIMDEEHVLIDLKKSQMNVDIGNMSQSLLEKQQLWTEYTAIKNLKLENQEMNALRQQNSALSNKKNIAIIIVCVLALLIGLTVLFSLLYINCAYSSQQNEVFIEGQCQCQAGYFINSNDLCIQCPAGTYQNQNNQKICIQCVNGTYSNLTTATSVLCCLNCSAGQYSTSGSKNCQICNSGTYSFSGSPQCINCPPGTYSNVLESQNISVCRNCSINTYSNFAGANNSQYCINCDNNSIAFQGAAVCFCQKYETNQLIPLACGTCMPICQITNLVSLNVSAASQLYQINRTFYFIINVSYVLNNTKIQINQQIINNVNASFGLFYGFSVLQNINITEINNINFNHTYTILGNYSDLQQVSCVQISFASIILQQLGKLVLVQSNITNSLSLFNLNASILLSMQSFGVFCGICDYLQQLTQYSTFLQLSIIQLNIFGQFCQTADQVLQQQSSCLLLCFSQNSNIFIQNMSINFVSFNAIFTDNISSINSNLSFLCDTMKSGQFTVNNSFIILGSSTNSAFIENAFSVGGVYNAQIMINNCTFYIYCNFSSNLTDSHYSMLILVNTNTTTLQNSNFIGVSQINYSVMNSSIFGYFYRAAVSLYDCVWNTTTIDISTCNTTTVGAILQCSIIYNSLVSYVNQIELNQFGNSYSIGFQGDNTQDLQTFALLANSTFTECETNSNISYILMLYSQVTIYDIVVTNTTFIGQLCGMIDGLSNVFMQINLKNNISNLYINISLSQLTKQPVNIGVIVVCVYNSAILYVNNCDIELMCYEQSVINGSCALCDVEAAVANLQNTKITLQSDTTYANLAAIVYKAQYINLGIINTENILYIGQSLPCCIVNCASFYVAMKNVSGCSDNVSIT